MVIDPTGVSPGSGGDTLILFTPENESLDRTVDDTEDAPQTKDGKISNRAAPSDISFGSLIPTRSQNVRRTVYTMNFAVVEQSRKHLSAVSCNADRSAWWLEVLSMSNICRHH